MSFPERTVILSPEAQDDLTSLLLFGLQEWGEAQSDRYAARFERAIRDLAHFAEIGERRPQLFPGCRVRLIDPYIVYYRILGDVVEIVRILHERADPARHLNA